MKNIKFLLFFILIIVGTNAFSQSSNNDVSRIMYINARSGLRVRSDSNINSSVLGTLQYGAFVRVLSRSNNQVTIDGITNYWYSIWFQVGYNSQRGWLFGGYLSSELPDDIPVVVGIWDDINNQRQYYRFGIDFTYSEGYKETGMGLFGTWRISGNIITLHLTTAGTAGDTLDEKINIRINIINRNNIELIINNEIVRLRRNNSGEGW